MRLYGRDRAKISPRFKSQRQRISQ